jgi:hypothetical protein
MFGVPSTILKYYLPVDFPLSSLLVHVYMLEKLLTVFGLVSL